MNNFIKLRVWDTEKEMFVPEGEITYSFYGDTRISVTPNSQEYIGDSCHNGEPQRGRFIVDLYSGLMDKKGNEIFNGDIVKLYNGSVNAEYDHHTFLVEFTRCKFVLKPISDFKRVIDLGYFENRILVKGCDEITIIGNKHNNPELLK